MKEKEKLTKKRQNESSIFFPVEIIWPQAAVSLKSTSSAPPQVTFPLSLWNWSAEIKALRTSSIGNARLAAVQTRRVRQKRAPERDCHGAFSMTPSCPITLRAKLTTSSCSHGRVTSTRASYVTCVSGGKSRRARSCFWDCCCEPQAALSVGYTK